MGGCEVGRVGHWRASADHVLACRVPSRRGEFNVSERSAPVVNIVWRDVAKGFVISLGVVIIHERGDRFFKLFGRLEDRQIDPFLARKMIALDLADGARILSIPPNHLHSTYIAPI